MTATATTTTTRELSPKPNRGRGGTHPGKQSQNLQISVGQLDRELDTSGTDIHAAIPYKDETLAEAATNDSHLKLMFRLLKFEVQEEQDSEQDEGFYPGW